MVLRTPVRMLGMRFALWIAMGGTLGCDGHEPSSKVALSPYNHSYKIEQFGLSYQGDTAFFWEEGTGSTAKGPFKAAVTGATERTFFVDVTGPSGLGTGIHRGEFVEKGDPMSWGCEKTTNRFLLKLVHSERRSEVEFWSVEKVCK